MRWVDVEQNTDEWVALRCGRIGGSSIGCIMANYGKAFGAPAHKLAVNLAVEQITGQPQESGYTNDHMQRGHEQEPIARELYEHKMFCDVTNGGYFQSGSDEGCSPDGLVSYDGLIEIKSVIATVQFDTVKRKKLAPAYRWQHFFNLKVSGRKWIDFVSFCAEFPRGKRLFTDRVYREKIWHQINMIDIRIAEFRELIGKKKTIINNI